MGDQPLPPERLAEITRTIRVIRRQLDHLEQQLDHHPGHDLVVLPRSAWFGPPEDRAAGTST